jgi:lysophospholipase L1-like esterase
MPNPRRLRAKHALLLAGMGSIAAIALVEIALRIATNTLFLFGGLSLADPVVGSLPRPNTAVRDPYRGCTMTIGDHSTRVNGNPPPLAERPLTLAVGDSFTFGQDVGDTDSWPAALERLLHQRVINGGVNRFGFDQAVLRAEQLAEVYAPDVIIVGFIPHDVVRCEYSYFIGRPKPYFDLNGSGLRQHSPPVPPQSLLSPARKLLLRMSIAANVLAENWLVWEGPYAETVHHQGVEVACRLMERLAALGRARHARIIVLAQPQQPSMEQWERDIKDRVLACAQANELLTLDLFPVIEALPAQQRARLFNGHMKPEGNRLVADELARLIGRGLPTPAEQSP